MAYTTVQLGFPGSHSFTVPAGITQLYYILVGGGGGGNVLNATSSLSGGGGQAISGVVAVTPGDTLSVQVGAGGSPGANGGNSTVTGTGVSLTALAGLANGQSRGYNNAGVLNTPAARPAGSPYYGATNGAGTNGSASSTVPGVGKTVTSVDLSTYYLGQGGAATASSQYAVTTNGTNFVGGGGSSGPIKQNYDGYGNYSGPAVDGYGNPTGFQAGGTGGSGAVYFAYDIDYTSRILSMSTIQATFPSGVNPISLSEYYAGGVYVPAGTVGYPGNTVFPIPSSGVLSISNFEGALPGWIFNYTLGSGAQVLDLNVFDLAMAAGFPNGQGLSALALRAYINIAGTAGASSTSSYGLSVGTGYNKTPLVVINVSSGGIITGAGGGSSVATAIGGNALLLTQPTLLVNNGIIQAGGGASIGGAGGAGYVAGVGVRGSTSGSLQSGGTGFPSSSGKKSYSPGGGYGGGWVSNSSSPSTDGWGAGRDNGYHGGYQPGYSIVGTGQLQAGSVNGTLRGATRA